MPSTRPLQSSTPKQSRCVSRASLHDRAALGGEEYLDGFAVYDTGKGYQHIVTYGLSELYPSMGGLWLGIQQMGL